MRSNFEEDRDHAPINSEIYALFDSIGADYILKNGIVTVVTKYGDVWDFSEPRALVLSEGQKGTISTGTAYKALFETPAHEAHLVKRKSS